MRKRFRILIHPKHLFILLIVLCFVLMFVSFRYSNQMAPIKTAVGNVISPMQKGINAVGKGISDQFEKLDSLSRLMEENTQLKEEINVLSYENKILLQDKYELERFRELYELDQKYADYPKVAAKVISADPNNWYNTFFIDKGTDDGIAVDMNVISGNGLVGIIEEAGKNYSKVRSIIDDSSYVRAMFLKTSDACMVKGDLELLDTGVIRVELIDKNAEIYDGYEVVTSHISEKYLQGILIGYINNIQTDASNLTKTAELTPAVNFERLEEVLIITELKDITELIDSLD